MPMLWKRGTWFTRTGRTWRQVVAGALSDRLDLPENSP